MDGKCTVNDDNADRTANLFSSLRNHEAEIRMRKALEERLRNTKNPRTTDEVEKNFSNKPTTNSYTIKSLVTVPVQNPKTPIRSAILSPKGCNRSPKDYG